jgi:hypothetical protein
MVHLPRQVPAVGRIPRQRFPLPSPDEEDDDDYHIVKEEKDEAMENAAPPGAGDLPWSTRQS